jgi:hypothetical protein
MRTYRMNRSQIWPWILFKRSAAKRDYYVAAARPLCLNYFGSNLLAFLEEFFGRRKFPEPRNLGFWDMASHSLRKHHDSP